MRKRWTKAFALTALVAIFMPAGRAQYREYLISGKVVDSEKQPLPGVEITLLDEATSRRYLTKTDKNGEFKLAGLPHGIYTITIKKEGHRSFQDTLDIQAPQERMQKIEIPTITLAREEIIQQIERAREAQAEFTAATEKLRQEDFDGAMAILNGMLVKSPNDANAHYLLGAVFLKKKMLPEAMAAFTKTTEIVPAFAGAYHQLGLCYQEQKEPEKALEFYKKAAELEPRSIDSWYNAGLILFGLNRVPEALPFFEKAVELRPEDPEFLEMSGRCYIHQGDFVKALERLEKAMSLSKDPEKIKFLEQLVVKLKEQIKS